MSRMLCRLYLLSLSKRRTFVVICVFLIIIFMMFILYADKKGIRIRRDSIDAYPHPIIVREKTIQQEYVDYSVHQFNLKPLDQQTIVLDYPQELGKVINDVLSFQYLLDVGFDLMNKTCLKWNMDEETFQQRAKRTLLIVVISAVGNFERRRILRESWASRDGVLVAANSVQVVFLVGLSSNQSATMNLKNESSFYRDIIQVNTIDAYSNLTLKSVALLHWTHTHCRKVDWVLKCDDDNYVNGELFLTLLKRLGTNSDFSIYGKVVPTLVPERKKSQKHYISRSAWPWASYPSYLMGGAYLISGYKTVRRLLAASQSTPFFPFEDVFLTGLCAARVNVNLHASSKLYRPDYTKIDSCMVHNVAIWQTASKEKLLESHKITTAVYRDSIPCHRKQNVCFFGTCL